MHLLNVLSLVLFLLVVIHFNDGSLTNNRNLFHDLKAVTHPSGANSTQGNSYSGNVHEGVQLNRNGSSLLRYKRETGWITDPIFYLTYKIHDGFTASEAKIIANATQIVTNRLTKPKVRDCSYRITGKKGYRHVSDAWNRSNLKENDDYGGRKDLLSFHLRLIEALGVRNKLPVIHIKPYYEKSDAFGQGTLGCMTFTSKGTKLTYRGTFDVELNRYHLDSPTEEGRDAVFWAGVIVHEMLHNLGHDHKDYTDSWQINVFENCLVHDGNYWTYNEPRTTIKEFGGGNVSANHISLPIPTPTSTLSTPSTSSTPSLLRLTEFFSIKLSLFFFSLLLRA